MNDMYISNTVSTFEDSIIYHMPDLQFTNMLLCIVILLLFSFIIYVILKNCFDYKL